MPGFSRPLYLLGMIPIVFYHSEQIRSLLVSLHFAIDGDLQTNHDGVRATIATDSKLTKKERESVTSVTRVN